MNTQFINSVTQKYMKQTLPNVEVGDTVDVTTIIRDDKGEKKRTQSFKGLVIAIKNEGISRTITVRKISDGIGVEKIFPIHSPNVESIEILRKGKVRQSKIYYMRDRIGKAAMKVPEAIGKTVEDVTVYEVAPEPQPEVEEKTEATTEATEEVKEEAPAKEEPKAEIKSEEVEEEAKTEEKEA